MSSSLTSTHYVVRIIIECIIVVSCVTTEDQQHLRHHQLDESIAYTQYKTQYDTQYAILSMILSMIPSFAFL
jgi:hypothetical protein